MKVSGWIISELAKAHSNGSLVLSIQEVGKKTESKVRGK